MLTFGSDPLAFIQLLTILLTFLFGVLGTVSFMHYLRIYFNKKEVEFTWPLMAFGLSLVTVGQSLALLFYQLIPQLPADIHLLLFLFPVGGAAAILVSSISLYQHFNR